MLNFVFPFYSFLFYVFTFSGVCIIIIIIIIIVFNTMVYDIIPYCSLVAVVFKDTALVVNPLFQLHAKGILIFPRMCGSVIPWVRGQFLSYK